MTKIIFSDIDGTFLRDDKTVSPLHAKAIRSVIARGLKFVFVSARMPEAVYPITDAIDLPHTPIISGGGSLIITEQDQIIFDRKMTAVDTAEILTELKNSRRDITVNYYSGRRWFAEEIDRRVQIEMDITKAVAEPANFDDLLSEKILPNKILIICEPPTCSDMERVLGRKFSALNVVRSAPNLLEVTDRTVSKATGIEVLLEHYGCGVDEAIAFGDNYNDIEMLKLIPRSVAMANAPAPVKALAADVTDSNDDGGIYTCLVRAGIIEA